jgi:glycolate oxidase FAD binding subunit
MVETVVRPTCSRELADAICEAANSGARLSIRGGGSKDGIGDRVDATTLDMTGFSGVIDYDPAELVLTAWAGTPLAAIEAVVASQNQALAFAPFDHGPVYGRAAGDATIGGVIAAGVAGPLRLSLGGARDHLLGFEAVSGRGEVFKAGGRVVKNVTGFDLPKLMAGSWGRLAAMTQVTLRILPRPRAQLTKQFVNAGVRDALNMMAAAMRSAAEVRAAAHLPRSAAQGSQPVTALLLAGFPASITARSLQIDDLFPGHDRLEALADEESEAFWRAVATAAPLGGGRPLWRISAPASRTAEIGETLGLGPGDQLFDWAGGLLWAAYEGDAAKVRSAADAAGGQAMLVRAPAERRMAVAALHPRSRGVAALEERVRRAFDPAGLFETGRF